VLINLKLFIWLMYSSICCTDSLPMTHRGGLRLSIIIWRIEGEGQVFFCPGAKNSLGGPGYANNICHDQSLLSDKV
jgi:hypothetical protein